MPNFTYTAVNAKGKSVTGTVDLLDRSAVLASLTKQGLRPISVKAGGGKKLSSMKLFESNKIKTDDLVMFTRQLSAMISAGVPLLRALTSLEERGESPALRKTLRAITADIEGGSQLADALEKHSNNFTDIYVNMVRAGESAGILDDVLKRLALQQEKSTRIRKKVKSAMTYPMVLVGITVISFFGLMVFVIPTIGDIVKDLGGPDAELPGLTTFMLGVSSVIISYWYIIFPLLFGGGYGLLHYLRKTAKGRRFMHRLTLKIPGVSSIVSKVAIAHFARTFSSLMGAGVNVLESLAVTSRAVGNVMYEESLMHAVEEVKNGKQLSDVIDKDPLFPSIVSQMLAVGEETGQTDSVLIKVADFYEEEVDAAIDGISSIIEPVMIVFMGGMVGVIAASVMMPIAGMASSIQE